MDCSGTQILTWTICVNFFGLCVGQVAAQTHYMVAIPAVLQAEAENKFCTSLLEPTESLTVTVTLMLSERNMTLLQTTSHEEFHTCTQFMAPSVQTEVQNLEVEVRGDTFYSREVRKVMIKKYEPRAFVQTDKPIYIPGQTVHFRVVTLDNKLRPARQLYDIIQFQDPQNNRIAQWLNKTSSGTILQLSHSLSSEAREGTYVISVKMGEQKFNHLFKVEKYVLPKFDVKINVPKQINAAEEELDAKVCAKYTYGQPVQARVTIKVCRPVHLIIFLKLTSDESLLEDFDKMRRCATKTMQTDKRGCANFNLKVAAFTRHKPSVFKDVLNVTATVEEEGTGVSHPQQETVEISHVIATLNFFDTPDFYEKNSIVEGKVKAVYFNDTPIRGASLHLFEKRSEQLSQNLTTDSDGVASFTVNTESFNGDIFLRVVSTLVQPIHHSTVPFYQTKFHRLSVLQPPSPDTKTVSSLKVKTKDEALLCDKEEDISIQYTIVKENEGSVNVMYLVLSRGQIVSHGFRPVEVRDTHVNEGTLVFKLKVSPDMAPDVQVVAYAVLPSKNVIAHSADFSTGECFNNKVSLEFSLSSAVPGDQTGMQLSAQPHSLCGVSAIDQSVLIKEPGKTLTAQKIYGLLPVKKAHSFPYKLQDPTECLNVRPKRYIFPHPNGRENSAYEVFKRTGLKIATNLMIRIPDCLNFKGLEYRYGSVSYRTRSYGFAIPVSDRFSITEPSPPSTPPPLKTIRSFFPETWIWNLVEVGESGTRDVSFTVPDTITTWETEAFCLSPQGFGLASRKNLTVFQPFFLELTLPYSIIRGENFELKATVFNYLTSCIMVKVTAAPSPDYTLTPLSGNQYTSCLCGSERRTLSWTMTPTALGTVNVSVTAEAVPSHASCDNEIVSVPERGRIDVVTRPLIVKAEGTEVTTTQNWLLCPKGNALTEETEMQLPDNVIPGSARATVSVLGDILGRALNNLDGLLKMPYGCGEQNMALLAPNIYILHYLQNTQQLTEAIKEKAFHFLSSGYQRQLNYKDRKGAYSTFGSGPGNTWLTAFVMRSFFKAQSFIYIDPEKIQQSRDWLQSKQHENGCFKKIGKLFNNRMKGGVSDNVTLSAYVTAAFLEMNMSTNTTALNRSLSYLKESISGVSNTYTTALLAYVFTLAGDMETRAQLLQQLDTVAIKEGGVLYWSQTATETSASLSVEISSYVLMAKLSAPHTAEDLGYASSIVRWLTRQQNHYGGFSSTQDTVVALQALALYSTVVFSPEGVSTVTVASPGSQLTLDVTPENKLLYREMALQDVSGKYRLEVKGTACASVQISHHYNIPTPTNVNNLSVKVATEASCTEELPRPRLTLNLQSLFSGKEKSTNMVIVDIKVLTGFAPDQESLKKLRGAPLVDRVEQNNDHVLMYLQELRSGIATNHSLALVQELPVENLKPAVVKIYDYYQPSDQSEAEYIYFCTTEDNVGQDRE
ncbi:unnamed protein product [Menidia menidia]|uniref:(Atlantic silverside) hypothetical protein n=1 Tax=Menidia menidia TaxID=238744 RepID=A0A8S4BPK1_9TELE|nr:unnamed protein product [Menidia menidia]